MRARPTFKAVAAALALGFLLLLGAGTGSAFAHDVQHAGHHSAGMHSQGICAWMCAAGQSLDGIAVVFQAGIGPLALVNLPTARCPRTITLVSPVTRGPPPSV